MRSLNVLRLAIILAGTHIVSSSYRRPAFITCLRSDRRSVYAIKFGTDKASDDTLLDAQEAAAVDAHDVSDAGIEGASMERAVMMAAELFEEQVTKADHQKPKSSSLFGSIWSYFRHDNEYDIRVIKDAEATYAHDLSDMAAIEHANEIFVEDDEDEGAKSSLFNSIKEFFHLFQKRKEEDEHELMELRDAEANFAHTLSDVAALEHANEI